MKKINYKFCDGTQKQVEVSDEFFNAYQSMEKEMKLNERRETRRHISLDYLNESYVEIADENIDVFATVSKNHNNNVLKTAISMLNPAQQSLLRRVYFLGENLTEIARDMGVSRNAIVHQLNTILCRIKEKIRNL